MRQYLDLAQRILSCGEDKSDRTGVGTRGIFGPQLEFDLRNGFPAMTTKKLQWSSVVEELRWFVSGSTNIKDLKTNIWNEWADPVTGDLGPIYSKQWRAWWSDRTQRPIDQLHNAVERIKSNPACRRIIVSAWNVADLPLMRLPPCHLLFQFYVGFVGEKPTYLDCKVTQRSADMFLGVPFNIASYSLLTSIVARLTGLEPRNVIMSFGDAHLYKNHFGAINEQISRKPMRLPTLAFPEFRSLEDFVSCPTQQIVLEGYKHWPAIKGEIAV